MMFYDLDGIIQNMFGRETNIWADVRLSGKLHELWKTHEELVEVDSILVPYICIDI